MVSEPDGLAVIVLAGDALPDPSISKYSLPAGTVEIAGRVAVRAALMVDHNNTES